MASCAGFLDTTVPVFIAEAVKSWLRASGVQTVFIEPGSPWENRYSESFHSRLRDEVLNRELFASRLEAKVILDDYRRHYNESRPHSSLGYQTPGEVREKALTAAVVVAARQSGSYQDLDHWLALAYALLCLTYLMHSPTPFDDDLFVLWVALAYLAGLALAQKFPGWRRRLSSSARRLSQVVTQARAAFVEERVSSTRDRSGLLVYLSEFEREVVFLPDLGVDACLPRALFHEIEREVGGSTSLQDFQTRLLTQIERLQGPLQHHLPARQDDTNELDNAVRIRA